MAHLAEAVSCESLLRVVFENGARVDARESAAEVRGHAQAQIACLPEEFKRLRNPEYYPVLLSPRLGDIKERMLANPDQ